MYEKKEVMNKDLAKFTVRLKNCVDVDQVDTGSKKDFIFRVVQDRVGAFEFHAPTAEDRRTWCDVVREEWVNRDRDGDASPTSPRRQSSATAPPGRTSSTSADPTSPVLLTAAADGVPGDGVDPEPRPRGASAGSAAAILRQGWLQKQSSGWGKSWTARWVALRQGTSDGPAVLSLHDDPQVEDSCARPDLYHIMASPIHVVCRGLWSTLASLLAICHGLAIVVAVRSLLMATILTDDMGHVCDTADDERNGHN